MPRQFSIVPELEKDLVSKLALEFIIRDLPYCQYYEYRFDPKHQERPTIVSEETYDLIKRLFYSEMKHYIG